MMNGSIKHRRGALLYTKLDGRKLRCLACARRCLINIGARGYCRVRMNSNGRLLSRIYGRVVTAHIDTIEKKPVYHYRPGSKLLSLGTVGCNWSCDFCLNACISQADEIIGEKLSPEDLVGLAKRYGCQGIAYTYNEPLVFLEFARDIGILAHQEGLFNVVVTNGYGTPEAVEALSEFADCVTVGLKANASQAFLRRHSNVRTSKPIFGTLLDLKRKTNVHIEISNLVLGQGGDSQSKTRTLCRWIHEEMGSDTPLHFVSFHPSYQMKNAQPTNSAVLQARHGIAREAGLRYVYIANIPGHERENTFCPNCGEMVIGRFGYEVRAWNLDEENRCKGCGYGIPIVGNLTKTPPEERYAPVVFPPFDMQYICEGLSG